MFDSRYDADRHILFMTLEGFWTMTTVAAFTATMLARGTALRLQYGPFAVLADARTFPVQSSAVTHALEVGLHQGMKITSAPFYTVVGSMLNKVQAERVSSTPNSRVFLDWDEANACLEQEWVKKRAT